MKVSVANKIYIPLIGSFIVALFILLYTGFIIIKSTEESILQKQEEILKDVFLNKLDEKYSIGLTNSLILANNYSIKLALDIKSKEMALSEIENLSKLYKKYTKFKNIKIYLYDPSLSLIASNFSIAPKKKDILKRVLLTQKPIVSLDDDLNTIVLKSIAPVFYKNMLVGAIEFNQGLNSISKDLLKNGIYTLIVKEKKINKTSVALKDYAYSKEFFNELKNVKDLKDSFTTSSFYVIKVELKNINGKVIGYAFIGKKLSTIKSIIDNNVSKFELAFFVLLALYALLIYVFVMVVSKVVLKPLKEIRKGLSSFFEFLQDPSRRISPIKIKSKDEFEDMSNFINEGIEVSSALHHKLMEMMKIIDENILICEIDNELRIIDATKAFCEKVGIKKDEIISYKFTDMIADEEIKEKIIEAVKSESSFSAEVKVVTPNGEFWFSMLLMEQCYDENCKFLILNYDITDKKNIEELSKTLEYKVEERTSHLLEAKKRVEELHKATTQSIEFAALIQKAILDDESKLNKFFKDSFIIYQPRNIVGGDIYLFEMLKNENEVILMVLDCTGHGVPGAFVTMIVKAIEREIISKLKDDIIEISPNVVLKYFNRTIKRLLKQHGRDSMSNVGFDGGVIYYNRSSQIVKFAGAHMPLFIVKDNEVEIIQASKQSVGYHSTPLNYDFDEYIIKVKEGDKLYLSTDGYFDQLGGKKGLPFGKRKFMNVIKKVPFNKQKDKLLQILQEYKGEEEQNDDITIVGVEIGKKSNVNYIIDFEGELTQSIIAYQVEIIEKKIKNLKILPKLTTIVIELTQNILKHSADELSRAFIKVIKKSDEYEIISKNLIKREDKNKLESTLLQIKNSTKEEIKQKYKELRRANRLNPKGAGIGFFEIAKITNDIDFEFEDIENKLYFKVVVRLKE